MPRNISLFQLAIALFAATVSCVFASGVFAEETADVAPKVDFSYAFSTPHRITIGRPDASDRTLLDLFPEKLRIAWSYDNLAMPNYPLLAYKPPPTQWSFTVTTQIDGKPFAKSSWTRFDKVLPALDNAYEDEHGSLHIQALGGITAGLFRVEMSNTDSAPHQFTVDCNSENPWSENPAWLEPSLATGDNLVGGFNGRADRVLLVGIGADAYSVRPDGRSPGYNSMILVWNLKAGEKRVGWFVRPYNAYEVDLPSVRKTDCAGEWEQATKEWHNLLDRAVKVVIPDSGISNAYLACIADLFIMREPMVGGYVAGVIGTEQYRAGSSCDPAFATIALEQTGYSREAANGFKCSIEMQKWDGDWCDYQGWSHKMWGVSGFKSWTVMEHYRMTGDKSFLAAVYPRMLASSRFQESQRAHMRPTTEPRPVTYGLMPRGMGDGGLWNGDDLFGVFLPHNIWAVFADRCTMQAAEILGKTADLPELKKIYETANADLLVALDRGAIKEKDYRWIPGAPLKTSGSHWGVLNALTPCAILPPDHELVTGTLKQIEAHTSTGGLALHIGWLENGVWMAMSLDNVAEAHLARGEGDIVAKYLYAVINHGTPLYTWCEERGQEPGSKEISGDRQHEWTPSAVVRVIRDSLVMESGDGLNLALATERHWLSSGKPVGITAAPTHFGPVSYQMQFDAAKSEVTGEVKMTEDSSAAWTVLHIRLPGTLRVKSVDADSKATVLPDGSGIRWDAPRGTMTFHATTGE